MTMSLFLQEGVKLIWVIIEVGKHCAPDTSDLTFSIRPCTNGVSLGYMSAEIFECSLTHFWVFDSEAEIISFRCSHSNKSFRPNNPKKLN